MKIKVLLWNINHQKNILFRWKKNQLFSLSIFWLLWRMPKIFSWTQIKGEIKDQNFLMMMRPVWKIFGLLNSAANRLQRPTKANKGHQSDPESLGNNRSTNKGPAGGGQIPKRWEQPQPIETWLLSRWFTSRQGFLICKSYNKDHNLQYWWM